MSGILNGHNSIENNARGLVIDSSSSSIYIVGDGSDIIYELKISTYPSGFQIARYSPLISGQEGTGEAIFFSSDGTKFYILGQANDRVYQYELTTAWDLNDFYYSQKSFAVTQEGTAGGLFFKPDGTKFYIVGTTNDTVYQYSCATAWDVSTASYDSKSFSIGGQESTARGLFFKPDGTRFYVGGNTNNNVYEYVCSTAWDVSTAAFSGARFNAIQLNFLGTNIFDLAFNSSGTKFYIVSISPNPVVLEFKCSSPWYILDAMWTGVSFNTTNQDSDMRALFIKPDDTKLYLLGQTTDRVFIYQLV
jgi:hypothetical protein